MDSKFWSDMGKAVAIAAVSTVVSRCIVYGMDSYYQSSSKPATPEGDAVADTTVKPAAEDKPKTDTPAADATTATAAANDEPAAEAPTAAAVRQRFSLYGNDDERGVA